MAALTPQTIVDQRYQLIAKIGEGTFGEVWKARDQHFTSRVVALKWLKLEHVASPESVARFEAEANALELLQNPYIVSVLDQGTLRNSPYIVMEYLPGETLAQWLAALRAMRILPDLNLVRDLFDDICAGVAAAHAVVDPGPVVHRDIKPDNIILWRSGAEVHPKVLDFGIARLGPRRKDSRTGRVLGTVDYMAPEQAIGDTGLIGPASDVFALGVLLIEMLTLQSSPNGAGASQWWGVALTERISRSMLEGLRDGVSPEIWAVLEQTLAREVPTRIPTAAALRASLRAAWGLPAASSAAKAETGAHVSRTIDQPPLDAIVKTEVATEIAAAIRQRPSEAPVSVTMGSSVIPSAAARRWTGSGRSLIVAGTLLAIGLSAALFASHGIESNDAASVAPAPTKGDLPDPPPTPASLHPEPPSVPPPPARACLDLGDKGCRLNHCCDGDSLACSSTKSEPELHCCRGVNASCTDGPDCCGYMNCIGGQCVCVANNLHAMTAWECCSGKSEDREGVGATCCGAVDATCGDTGECCGSMQCVDGRCACDPAGTLCYADGECCSQHCDTFQDTSKCR